MDNSQRLETINNLKRAIELAGDGGPQPFTSEEYKLMYELMDELSTNDSVMRMLNTPIFKRRIGSEEIIKLIKEICEEMGIREGI